MRFAAPGVALAGVLALAGCATRAELVQQDRQAAQYPPGAAQADPGGPARGRAAAWRSRGRSAETRERGELDDERLKALEERVSGSSAARDDSAGGAGRSVRAPRRRPGTPPAPPPPTPPVAGRRRSWPRRTAGAGRSPGSRPPRVASTCPSGPSISASSTASRAGLRARRAAAQQLRRQPQRLPARRQRALLGGALLRAPGDQNQAISKFYDVVTQVSRRETRRLRPCGRRAICSSPWATRPTRGSRSRS